MTTPSAFETLAAAVGSALAPLAGRLSGDGVEEVLEELGLRLPAGMARAGPVLGELQKSAATCAELPDAVTAFLDTIGGDDDGALIAAAGELGRRIVAVTAAFVDLGNAIDGLIQASAALTPAQQARLRAIVADLPDRLLHLAIITWIEERRPMLAASLALAGLVDDIEVPGDPADPSVPPHLQRAFRLDRLGSLAGDPAQHLSDLYGFGLPGFDGIELFGRLRRLVDRPHAKSLLILAPGQPAALEAFVFRAAVTADPVPGVRVRVRVNAQQDIDVTVPIDALWSATATAEARFASGLEFEVDPSSGIHIEPPAAAASIQASFGIAAERSDGTPIVLIGEAGKSRLELGRITAALPVRASAAAGAASPEFTLGAEVSLERGRLVIDASGSDGFIATILGDGRVQSDFEVGAAYDTEDGLRFTGSGALEIAIPTHLSLGPISIDNVYLVAGFSNGSILVEFSADLGAQLGPLAAVVSRMGAQALITFPDGGGNAGLAQVDLGFQPPSGVGLALDAGPVKGGGFLYFDTEREEYAGALELVFNDWISLKAIGLVTTRLPDGSKGFSLLIIITVEFGTGIQLGLGFTLIGVGGLLGLNRVVRIEPLAEGVRTGAIESLMFPKNVIANAPRIISDLRAFFPPQRDVFLIGPMAKIGWGTPTLVSIQLGVVLEFPSVNITILGVIKVVLPDEQADVLRLQVNFIGRFEPSNKLLWFYAELFDSRILFITIEGGFGLLVSWGNPANFVVTAGGFHPRYDPPPLPFPEPPRLAVSILNESYARIRIEGYFAVTSNSVQFGARAELFFGLSEFRIEGHLSFDVLFQFDPFFFSFSLSVSLSVKVFGVGLFSVGFKGHLEGPTPWYVKGKGKISLLFFKISVPFSHRWGGTTDTKLSPIAVYPLLEQELEALTNWQAEVPSTSKLLVSLRQLGDSADDRLVLHPVGRLRVSQRRVPLGLTLDKVGNQKPSDYNRFEIQATLDGGGSLSVSPLREQFAIGQYKELSASEKTSAPGFQSMGSGVAFGMPGEQIATSRGVRRVIRYETIIIDTNFKQGRKSFFEWFLTGVSALNEFLFAHFLVGTATAQSPYSKVNQDRLKPFTDVIEVQPHLYSVVSTADNRPMAAAATSFSSQAAAQQFLGEHLASTGGVGPELHVVPNTEVNTAA